MAAETKNDRLARKVRRTVFAWGRIPAGRRGDVSQQASGVPRRRDAFGRYPRSEQLSIFAAPGDPAPALRELRLPSGGPSPLPGPWTLSAVVSGSTRA